jgi:hypothetical protein
MAALVALELVTTKLTEDQARLPEPVDVEKSSVILLHTFTTDGALNSTAEKRGNLIRLAKCKLLDTKNSILTYRLE